MSRGAPQTRGERRRFRQRLETVEPAMELTPDRVAIHSNREIMLHKAGQENVNVDTNGATGEAPNTVRTDEKVRCAITGYAARNTARAAVAASGMIDVASTTTRTFPYSPVAATT
jgi:hypothetical protein